ncbi:MAG: dienelactone hydrolase family protein [Betaproteobacteria bacterium]|nr:dienelactone hydrolase family protein [Betaproteobacteria bacterium]
MDPKVVALYDEYTHAPLPRRTFLERLATIAGGTAAAYALLPMLENDYARAAIVAPDDARIAVERVPIRLPGGEMRAYVAVPRDGPAKRAGVIVIHENRGLNPHIEDVARRVALAGFTAIGVDMLSAQGGTPADEDRARGMIAKVDRAAAVADLSAVVDWLRARPDANGRVGTIGFCWGGGMANALAAAVPSLDAAVPFYGVAPPSADVARIRARLLLHYAGNDPRINAGIEGYEAALKAAGVAYTAHVYEGTEHAFHSDTAGARYNEAAAKLAWTRTIAFLQSVLG